MRRALQLAACGASRVSPNPQVGAVIVAPDGRIIGEGYHRTYGTPHAEPNAVTSVREADRHLLPQSTIYVTLEPCSHYGKTPPCADLLVRCGFRRAVIGILDPFPAVAGRGVQRLRDAGIDVEVGCMEEECRAINRRFLTAHTLHRPYIQLKWAQSADLFIASSAGEERAIFSTPLSMMWMHRERTLADAIMVGPKTVLVDNPRLDCRLWPGRKPLNIGLAPVSDRLPQQLHFFNSPYVIKADDESLQEFLHRLYTDYKISSLMVEGGSKTLQAFIDAGLYDEIRIETSPQLLHRGVKAPTLPSTSSTTPPLHLADSYEIRDNVISIYHAQNI